MLEIKNDIERLFTLNNNLEDILKLHVFHLSRDSKYYFVNKTIALQLAYEELFPIAKEVESVKKLYYNSLRKFIIHEQKHKLIVNLGIDIILKFIYTIYEGTYQFDVQDVMQSSLCEKDLDFYISTIMNRISA